jgi:phosphoglycerate dehydrogenase-like enzyme
MSNAFHVGITRSLSLAGGRSLMAAEALDLLEREGITYDYYDTEGGEVRAGDIAGCDAIVLLGDHFGYPALEGNERLVAVARWGVGYDNVDFDACTAHNVCAFITPAGVRRPVAVAMLTFLLTLALKVPQKDRLVRSGEWDRKTDYMGEMLTGKVVGSLGLGNIGREFFRLVAPLEMRHIACDPFVTEEEARTVGVQLVDKGTLLRESDYLFVTCLLTPETYHSIGSAELAQMKSSAYLINTARGPIVDEEALIGALQSRRIRGAALDVFEQEPLPSSSPLTRMENVLLAPHALAWTEESALGNSMEDAKGLVQLSRGEAPASIVNKAVLDRPGFQARLRTLQQRR